MAENSKIEWTDHTFNPWMGCTKVSPACTYCYAERDMDHRYGKVAWGNKGTRVVTSDANWKKPDKWNRDAMYREIDHEDESSLGKDLGEYQRPRVFCASLADVFEDWDGPMTNSKGEQLFWSHSRHPHESAFHWIGEPEAAGGESPVTMSDVRLRLFALIDATQNLDWLLLTKRPENIKKMWPTEDDGSGGKLAEAIFGGNGRLVRRRDNVWLGTSVESSDYLYRIDTLKSCGDLASNLFISAEPVVGPMPTLGEHIDGIDWVIAGGESGPNARPADPEWYRSIRDQCLSLGIPFHFKQWGEFNEHQVRVGKKAAGRVLDGITHDGVPVSACR